MEETRKLQRQKISIITSFMRKRGLNKSVAVKVRKFFEYYLRLDHEQDSKCGELINCLTYNLKAEVKIDLYKKYLKNIKVFKKTFSDE